MLKYLAKGCFPFSLADNFSEEDLISMGCWYWRNELVYVAIGEMIIIGGFLWLLGQFEIPKVDWFGFSPHPSFTGSSWDWGMYAMLGWGCKGELTWMNGWGKYYHCNEARASWVWWWACVGASHPQESLIWCWLVEGILHWPLRLVYKGERSLWHFIS